MADEHPAEEPRDHPVPTSPSRLHLSPVSHALALYSPHVMAKLSGLQRVLTGAIQCPILRERRGAETDTHQDCPVVATKHTSWMANNEEPDAVPAWLQLNALASSTLPSFLQLLSS